ncbi:MAG: hypothetical protein ACRDUY_01695 [Nitriliruptorales bacterium]
MVDTEQEQQPIRTRAAARPKVDAGVALIVLLGLVMVLQVVWVLGRAGG